MEKQEKYIYGIVNSNLKEATDRYWTIDNEKVYTVSYQDISAVVSDSRIADCALKRKDILARQLVKHQRIIEGIMPEHTIIPMKLGTIALDESEVREVLVRGYKVIKDIFAKINDKIEIDVVAAWNDFNSIIKEAGEEKEIKEFKDKLLANPKGITTDDQMKIGLMLKKALDEKIDRYVKEIQDALKALSDNCRMHELMDDKMVLNSAFLILKSKREDFYRKVEELNNKFAEKLNFRCVGPLPAYSFFTLEIKKIESQEIDQAKNKLNLPNNFINKDEIKKAFRKAVFSCHPDKNPNVPGIEKEYDEVIKAYKMLLEYSGACEQIGQQDNRLFNEEERKKDAILVRVRPCP